MKNRNDVDSSRSRACSVSPSDRVDERTVAAAPPFVNGIPVVEERKVHAGGIAPVHAAAAASVGNTTAGVNQYSAAR